MKEVTLKTASIRWGDNFSMEVCGYDHNDKFFWDAPKVFDIKDDGTAVFECYAFRFTLEQTPAEFASYGLEKNFKMARKEHKRLKDKYAACKMNIRALAMASNLMKRSMAAAYQRDDFDEAHLCRINLRENAIKYKEHVEMLEVLKFQRHVANLLVKDFSNILSECEGFTK